MGSTAIEDILIPGDSGYWLDILKYNKEITIDIHIRTLYHIYLKKYPETIELKKFPYKSQKIVAKDDFTIWHDETMVGKYSSEQIDKILDMLVRDYISIYNKSNTRLDDAY
jgi:hypothetical protein